MPDQILQYLGEMLIYGGGSAAIAYLLFQYLGKTWIENKFSQSLEQLKHQQSIEIQRLRVEIDSLLSGAIKLQEHEFRTLPEAWGKLDEAYGLVTWLVHPMQEYPSLDKLTQQQLEEFLEETEFTETQKDEVRSSRDKLQTYTEVVFRYRLYKVKLAFAQLQSFVARNGIFFPVEIKTKLSQISEMLWSALDSKVIGHEVKDYKMQNQGWKKIKEDVEPLYKSIETDIQNRLQSHGRKS